ncbi:MAG TPA: nickel-dependent lactate racemase [Thermoleophilia bacterium]|nr:nickel-dependent lactate racemase [Thermoleophilia bacterium]
MTGLQDLDAVIAALERRARAAGCDVRRLGVAEPAHIDLSATLADALAHPVGAPPLRELAQGRRSAVIITSDATRPVPAQALLGPVMAQLGAAGLGADAVDVVIGGGAHRPPNGAEVRTLLGKEWTGRLRVHCHDARAADLVDLGRTPAGTPLFVHPLVAAADLRIAFGQVEPHEFAGFTGGRKSILPAVAGEASILANHSLANLSHPWARPGILDGNPVHEDMLAAARLARLDFIVNVALGGDLQPLAVAAGDVEAAHAALTDFVRGFAQLEPPEGPVDVVVTGPGAPLDINLYQSSKPLVGLQAMVEAMAARAADAPAAVWRPPVVVLLSSCWDGTGSDEMLAPFAGARDPQEVLDRLRTHYTVEMNETFNIGRFLTVCPQVVACCPGVADDDLRRLFFTPAPTPEAALQTALILVGQEAAAGAGAVTAPAYAAASPAYAAASPAWAAASPTPVARQSAVRPPSVLFFPRAHRALFAVPSEARRGPTTSTEPQREG